VQPKLTSVPRLAVAAAAVLVLTVGAIAVLARRSATAASENGTLSFSPALARPGEVITVTYWPPQRFDGESVLALRARFSPAPQDVPPGYESEAAVVARVMMRRGTDGLFRQTLTFPSNAAYGAFVVEDSAAERIDTNARRYWEMLATDPDGRPTFAALTAAADRSVRGWNGRYDAARALVRAYPDSLTSWRELAFMEVVSRGQPTPAVRAAHRAALDRFDRAARSESSLTPERLGMLMWYAITVKDSAREAYWRARLLEEAPRSPLAVQERTVAILRRFHKDTLATDPTLTALEALWTEVGPAHPILPLSGFQVAVRSRDPRAIERWGDRWYATPHHPSWVETTVAEEYAKYPRLRAKSLAMLRRRLAPTDAIEGRGRGLSETASARRQALEDERAATLQHIGEALLASGAREAALDTLRLAATVGWNRERLRSVAAAALSAHDTTEAVQNLALVALDPQTSPVFADSARAMIGFHPLDARWSAALDAAAPVLRTRVLGTSIRRSLRGREITLTSPDGTRRSFAKLAGGRITVVAFGLELARPGLVDANAMQRLAARLSQWNAQVLAIDVAEPRTPETVGLVQRRGLTYPIAFDLEHDAVRAFEAYGIPMYFVVDADGDLRFAYSRLDDVLVQVSVLAQQQVAQTR
jgi:peroxiredoxin